VTDVLAWSYCQAAGVVAKWKTNQLEQFKKKSLLGHKELTGAQKNFTKI